MHFSRLHAELCAAAAAPDLRIAALLEAVLNRTGYRQMLADDGVDEDGNDRLANVEELITAAQQLDEDIAARGQAGAAASTAGNDDPLTAFLETTALVADTDIWDPTVERVALMTFHAAKGLEFPVVYLVAMEDGILPHERSLDHPDQLEEERRLVFVGITRGMQEVHASCARMRDYRGTRRISAPSVFLTEMTGSETVLTGPEAPASGNLTAECFFAEAPAGDEHCDDEAFAADAEAAPTTQITRQDGLTLELEDAPAAVPRRRPTRESTAFATAADLAARLGGIKPKHNLSAGQRVRHAEYGAGVLSGISGTGPRSVGTVIFDGPAGTRKFILGHGAIEPADEK